MVFVAGLVNFLLFLVMVEDSGAAYKSHLFAPMDWVHGCLLEPTPIVFRPFDLLMLGILIIASQKRDPRGGLVAPMKSALLLVLGTTVVWFLIGIARGGNPRYASWQTYLIFSSILVAFTVASTHRTTRHYRQMGKWMMAAATYHALMCWISYFTWGRDMVGESGAFLTSHQDTIPWVVAILILVVQAIERRTTAVTLRNSVFFVFIAGAIQFNSRRLAWVALASGLIVTYFLVPRGAAMQRAVRRGVRVLAPILLVYVIVGWGRGNRIFLPLRSLSSVTTQEDASTLARNVENLGLIATANFTSPITGAGWGHPYACLSTKYDISGSFELWQYIPHNSILGLLGFTGMLGFAGFWLALPTAVFLNARVARMANDPRLRPVAVVGGAQLIVAANQLYGDMGIFSLPAMYVIAISYAMALRLPRLGGVWGSAAPSTALATSAPVTGPSATPQEVRPAG
jgi:hypothetical protein